jgi:hypothetical protein
MGMPPEMLDRFNKAYDMAVMNAQGYGLGPAGSGPSTDVHGRPIPSAQAMAQERLANFQKNMGEMLQAYPKYSADVYQTGMRYAPGSPDALDAATHRMTAETDAGYKSAMIPIQRQEAIARTMSADSSAKHYEALANQFQVGSPGSQFIDKEGNVRHTVPTRPDPAQTASLWKDVMLNSHDKNPLTGAEVFNPYKYVQMTRSLKLQVAPVNSALITPYAENRIAEQMPGLKKGSKEYNEAVKKYQSLVYQDLWGKQND